MAIFSLSNIIYIQLHYQEITQDVRGLQQQMKGPWKKNESKIWHHNLKEVDRHGDILGLVSKDYVPAPSSSSLSLSPERQREEFSNLKVVAQPDKGFMRLCHHDAVVWCGVSSKTTEYIGDFEK